MTFKEARAICEEAAWAHEVPLVELFDELVEVADKPEQRYNGTVASSGKVTSAFMGIPIGQATGLIVAIVLGQRRQAGLPIYEKEE